MDFLSQYFSLDVDSWENKHEEKGFWREMRRSKKRGLRSLLPELHYPGSETLALYSSTALPSSLLLPPGMRMAPILKKEDVADVVFRSSCYLSFYTTEIEE